MKIGNKYLLAHLVHAYYEYTIAYFPLNGVLVHHRVAPQHSIIWCPFTCIYLQVGEMMELWRVKGLTQKQHPIPLAYPLHAHVPLLSEGVPPI